WAMRSSSSSVRTLACRAAPPFFAAVRMALRLPGVVAPPPTYRIASAAAEGENPVISRATSRPNPSGEPPSSETGEMNTTSVGRALRIMQAEFQPATWKACWECVVAGRPPEAVAAELGISVNAVYLAKSRVLRRLHEELRGLLD